MSFSKIYSAQTNLLSVTPISVETDISRGLNSFAIVGLPDKAVEEARDRVSAAIKNSGFDSPKAKNHKIIISLAPADQKKEGPSYDVAIALSYLVANKDISFDHEGKIFLGELSLDGKVRPIHGVLPIARFAKQKNFKELYVPMENVREAAIIDGINVFGISSLAGLIEHLSPRQGSGQAGNVKIPKAELTVLEKIKSSASIDFSDIRGQERAKRGLLIARQRAGTIRPCMVRPGRVKQCWQKLLPVFCRNLLLKKRLRQPVFIRLPEHSLKLLLLILLFVLRTTRLHTSRL